jgi:hypothetical protein
MNDEEYFFRGKYTLSKDRDTPAATLLTDEVKAVFGA